MTINFGILIIDNIIYVCADLPMLRVFNWAGTPPPAQFTAATLMVKLMLYGTFRSTVVDPVAVFQMSELLKRIKTT